MTTNEIIDCIGDAGSWLPILTVRRAFTNRGALTPVLLEAIEQRAAAKHGSDIRNHGLATFGIFFLAQIGTARFRASNCSWGMSHDRETTDHANRPDLHTPAPSFVRVFKSKSSCRS